ncbi:MAG: T9SS type A sorting domain-containing protein [Bacteroidetes bacterium]|nr:T9SS type A sorting domain-containing protein [Bacteroidota bacterium]
MSNKIAVDEVGNSFVFGSFVSSVVFGSESSDNEVKLTSDTYVDMFIASYDSSGKYLWTKRLDDNGYGGVSQIRNPTEPERNKQVPVTNNPLSLSYSNTNGGELILGGDFNNQLFLNGTTLTAEEGSRNSFIAKLSLTGNPTNVKSINSLPSDFSLSQNYPNPFNPNTIISYQLPEQSNVKLKIYDMLGREIKTLVNDVKPAGSYNISFNAANLSSGIYFYTINTPSFSQSKKMMLIK